MSDDLEEKKEVIEEKKEEAQKERTISLNDLAKAIHKNVYDDVTKSLNEVLRKINESLGNIAYRIYGLELVTYKLVKKGKIDNETLGELLQQEDILTANVETMLERIKEVRLKNKEALENRSKSEEKKEAENLGTKEVKK